MSHTPHTLIEEFAEYTALIHFLNVNDRHFKRMCERYEDVNRRVVRAEANIEAVSSEQMSELRYERVRLKDKIAAELRRDRRAGTTSH